MEIERLDAAGDKNSEAHNLQCRVVRHQHQQHQHNLQFQLHDHDPLHFLPISDPTRTEQAKQEDNRERLSSSEWQIPINSSSLVATNSGTDQAEQEDSRDRLSSSEWQIPIHSSSLACAKDLINVFDSSRSVADSATLSLNSTFFSSTNYEEDLLEYHLEEEMMTSRTISSPQEEGLLIVRPTDVDILFGRGGNINGHAGNKRYLNEVSKYKFEYYQATKKRKENITNEVLQAIKSYGARFLEYHNKKGFYVVVNDKKARKKISQRFRDDMERKKAPAAATSFSQGFFELTDTDIFCGRCGSKEQIVMSSHAGNTRFLALLSKYEVEFWESFTTRKRKCEIKDEISLAIKSYGGRFLELDRRGHYYISVSDRKEKRIIQQTFVQIRNKGRKQSMEVMNKLSFFDF
jgi:hypothetical protein